MRVLHEVHWIALQAVNKELAEKWPHHHPYQAEITGPSGSSETIENPCEVNIMIHGYASDMSQDIFEARCLLVRKGNRRGWIWDATVLKLEQGAHMYSPEYALGCKLPAEF